MKVYILLVRDDSGLPYPKKGDVFVAKQVRRVHRNDGSSHVGYGVEVELELVVEYPIAVAGWGEPEGFR